jgi:predicted PurR-regulated permease PerM
MTTDPIEDPVQALRESTAEVIRLHKAFTRRTSVVVAVSVAVLAVAVALAIAVVMVTRSAAETSRHAAENSRQIDESNRRWCPLILMLVPNPGEKTTAGRSQRIAAEAAVLARQFQCTPLP